MSRVGGVGRPPSPGDKQPDKKPQKKSKDAPSFDEVLKKKGSDEGKAGADGKKKGKGDAGPGGKGGVKGSGRGGPGGKDAPGTKKPGKPGTHAEAVEFTIGKEKVESERERMQTYRRETVKKEKSADDTAGAIGRTEYAAVVRHDAAEVQQAKASSLPPELVQKLVESVRVGQNRVGATEMQLGLKATVFEGMNLKIASKDGIVNVVMEVEQMAAKEKLEGEIQSLQDRLEAQGLSVGDITVELKGGGGGSAAGADTGDGGQGEGDSSSGGPGGPGGAGGAGPDRGTGQSPPRKPDSSTDYSV